MSFGENLEETININEEIRFKQKHREEMIYLAKTTHFSLYSVQRISLIYYRILKLGKKGAKGITREQLEDVLHYGFGLTDQRMLSGILAVIDQGDITLRNVYTLTKWVNILSLYLRGTLEEKIRYAFDVYHQRCQEPNMNRKNIVRLMKYSMVPEPGSDAESVIEIVKDLVDMMIKKMDYNVDGNLSFDDFRQSVLHDPLMLECMGHCLPGRLTNYALRQTLTPSYGYL